MSITNSTQPITDELLSAYLDGEVTASERRQVEAALQADPAVARALSGMRTAVALLHELPAVPAPHAFTLSEVMVGQARKSRSGWLAWLKPAHLRGAAALVAVCLLFVLAGNFGWQAGLLPHSSQTAMTVQPGGLAAGQGDPTAVAAKAPTTDEATQQPAGFLGLSANALLALEIGLAALLVVLVALTWRMYRSA